jgi:hypothetical protein
MSSSKTMTDLPLVEVSLDESGVVKDRDGYYNYQNESRIIKGNYLYSASFAYDNKHGESEIIVSKYDLSMKLLLAVTTVNLTQVFARLLCCEVLYSYHLSWLVPDNSDELWLTARILNYKTDLISGVAIIVKLKESDLSVIDIPEKQVDISPNKGNFVPMTFGKAKLEPEKWFDKIKLSLLNMRLYPWHDQLIAVFDAKLLNGRVYVGGFNDGSGTPVWFAINCCNYFDMYIHASTKNNNYYFGWGGEKLYESNDTVRLYAVEFNENFSTAELKYLDAGDDLTVAISPQWIRSNHVLPQCNSLICTRSRFGKENDAVMITFCDKDIVAYKIKMERDIVDFVNGNEVGWNFYHDPFKGFIYFICREYISGYRYNKGGKKPGFVLGYISFDHDNKTVTFHTTNTMYTGSSGPGYNILIESFMHPEYLYFRSDHKQGSLNIALFPTQWLHDNIVKSTTVTAERYEFDKKKRCMK